MHRLPILSVPLLLLVSLAGCGFSPGQPMETGTAGTVGTGTGTGTAGASGATTGGMITGMGGDVGPTGNGGSAGTTCATGAVPIMPTPPDVLLIQDRSGSMNDNDADMTCTNGCGATSKWALITAAINNVIGQTDTQVNWGLKFFADSDAVCGVANTVAVPVAATNAAPIAAAIAASTAANGGVTNGSHTPTAQAVTVGTAYLGTLTDQNPKYLLVATDGLPNCATGNQNGDNSPATEQAVAASLAAGFPVFVVGIATTSDAMATATLNAMAMAGGEAQTGGTTSYYNVTDTTSLEAALNKIVGIVASCQISLSTVPAADANTGNFVISVTDASTGKPTAIAKDATNGWSYMDANMTSIVLNGTSCANLQNGTYSSFAFNYACVGQPICIDPGDPNCSK